MPRFEPFAALRYARHEPLDEVTAPPYDVLSTADVEALLARHDAQHRRDRRAPRSRTADSRYERAAERLHDPGSIEGVLVRDTSPSLTLYRMEFTDADRPPATTPSGSSERSRWSTRAPTGCLPHERTTPKAKTDRLDLTRATHANLSPIWGLSLTSRAQRTARAIRASRSGGASTRKASFISSNESPIPSASRRSAPPLPPTPC